MTPEERLDELAETLEEVLEERELEFQIERALSEITLIVPAATVHQVAQTLRDAKGLQFEQCIDVCGVDYSAYGKTEWDVETASVTGFGRGCDRGEKAVPAADQRFAVVYHLMSVSKNHRLRLKAFLNADAPIVESVVDVWPAVNWFEREAFDLFGIMFSNHPDLRRILTDYGFVGHPFRRDFPLTGHVEMRYDPEQERVIYEPVSIEERTLVPRVKREDNRYGAPQASADNTDSTDA